MGKLKKLGLLDQMQSIDHFKLTKAFKEKELAYNEFEKIIHYKLTQYITRSSKLREGEIDDEAILESHRLEAF